jgi:protein O-GlcNAc transferase
VGQPAPVVEATIRADAPDILVDLAGHTGLNRLPLLARRLAPVQVTYLGYPNTTGVAALDYRFTDAIADPEGEAEAFATERLIRFAPTAWAYSPRADAPPVGPAPALTAGHVTFGCFNNPAKITDSGLQLWSRVLAAVPNSRLRLKGDGFGQPAVRARYEERLGRCGISVSRVDLLELTASPVDHLALYQTVDVAFDTFPYHGTTTTCEALWMGVPVISLAGNDHRSRVGASLLTAVGHSGWCARTPDEFVGAAVELAQDPAALNAIRLSLRPAMAASPLLDHVGQAARFGAALRAAWASWCLPGNRRAA